MLREWCKVERVRSVCVGGCAFGCNVEGAFAGAAGAWLEAGRGGRSDFAIRPHDFFNHISSEHFPNEAHVNQ
jgi:hypothetical protein